MAVIPFPIDNGRGDVVGLSWISTKKFTPNAVRTIQSSLGIGVTESERKDGYLVRQLDKSGEADSDRELFLKVATYPCQDNKEISRYYVAVCDEAGDIENYPLDCTLGMRALMTPPTVMQFERALNRVKARYGSPI